MLLELVNPSGRLPFTWPKRYSDLPFQVSKESWPGVDGRVHYEEGTDVGYRWYQKHDVHPQWWFGHGLSYSSFRATVTSVAKRCQKGYDIVVDVEKVGIAEGQAVVQCYTWPESRDSTKELRAFDKTPALAAGAKATVVLQLALRYGTLGGWPLVSASRDLLHWSS